MGLSLLGTELLYMLLVYSDTSVSTVERMKKKRTPSVIVIGAGMAGIAAARTLQDASFQVCKHDSMRCKSLSLQCCDEEGILILCLLSFSGCVIGVS